MAIPLTKELSDALRSTGEDDLEVIDPETQQLYVVVPDAKHRQAMEALRAAEDRAAISEGLRHIELGAGRPLAEGCDAIREQLGLLGRW